MNSLFDFADEDSIKKKPDEIKISSVQLESSMQHYNHSNAEQIFINTIFKDILGLFHSSTLHHANIIITNVDVLGDMKVLAKEMLINHVYDNSDVLIDAGNHPDLLWFKAKQIITLEDMSDIMRFMSLKSSISNNKVVILESPENMNASAANSILKIIEEPSKNTYFFFITKNYSKIIETIRSRCVKYIINSQVFRNQNLGTDLLETLVSKDCTMQDIEKYIGENYFTQFICDILEHLEKKVNAKSDNLLKLRFYTLYDDVMQIIHNVSEYKNDITTAMHASFIMIREFYNSI